MSSSRPPSGIGKRRAAWASATATGSVSSSSTSPGADRSSSARVSSSRAALDVGGQRAVADVVDAPREGVQRGHRLPLGGGQQPDAVGEVAGLLPGHGLAVAVRREHRCGRVRRSRPRSGSPLSSQCRRPPRAAGWSLVGLGGPGSTSYPRPRSPQRGPSSGHEPGEQQPEPAVDATHQGGAFIQQVAGAFGLVGDQGAHRCARRSARRGRPPDTPKRSMSSAGR